MQRLIPGALALLILTGASPARADAPPDPLRVLPAQAEWIVKIENPRQIIQTLVRMPLFEELKTLDVIREAYETTNARRFYQLVAYFEKELGHPYLELIDRLTGGGMVLAAKLSEGNRHFIAAVQAKDKDLLQRFLSLSLNVLEHELARQELKERLKRTTYKDIEVLRIGNVAHAAIIDATLIFGSDAKALHTAIDTLRDGKNSILGNQAVAQARKTLPEGPVAWTWLNLAAVREIREFKAGFEALTVDPTFLFSVGGLVDVVKRAPYAVAALSQRDHEFALTLRAPSGRDGMRGAELLVPADGGGSLPLLQPANVLASFSYYLDLGKFWEHRDKILNKEQLKQLDQLDQQSGPFLGGVRLGQLFTQAGPHQRVVVVQQTKPGYKVKPRQSVPGFAVVASMRDPKFGKNMETVARAAALFGSFKLDLKLTEEKHGPYTLVGYRFAEDKDGAFGADYQGIEFNFSPCFAVVGNQFIASSTLELGHELIDLIAKEENVKAAPASTRMRLYSTGAADILRTNQDALLTQLILGQALSPQEARTQLRQAIELVERLGVMDLDVAYGPHDARLNLRLRLGKK